MDGPRGREHDRDLCALRAGPHGRRSLRPARVWGTRRRAATRGESRVDLRINRLFYDTGKASYRCAMKCSGRAGDLEETAAFRPERARRGGRREAPHSRESRREISVSRRCRRATEAGASLRRLDALAARPEQASRGRRRTRLQSHAEADAEAKTGNGRRAMSPSLVGCVKERGTSTGGGVAVRGAGRIAVCVVLALVWSAALVFAGDGRRERRSRRVQGLRGRGLD
jgi:hypothetical protein